MKIGLVTSHHWPIPTPKAVRRFWGKVERNNPERQDGLGPCWTWRAGARSSKGYGQFWFAGRNVFAHRFAWELAHKRSAGDLCVCHRCDNPPCCNPAHLFLGTHADNAKDRNAKGRQSHGKTHGLTCSGPHKGRVFRGEDSNWAKIRECDVIEILRLSAAGMTQRSIAPRFGISYQQVSKIVRGQRWPHVDREAIKCA